MNYAIEGSPVIAISANDTFDCHGVAEVELHQLDRIERRRLERRWLVQIASDHPVPGIDQLTSQMLPDETLDSSDQNLQSSLGFRLRGLPGFDGSS